MESGRILLMEPKWKPHHQQQTSLGSGWSLRMGFRYRVRIRVRGAKILISPVSKEHKISERYLIRETTLNLL